MEKLRDMVPSVKLPKNIRKLKKWKPNATLDTIGNIGSNISQLVNRYIHPQKNENNETKMEQPVSDDSHLPPGVSTISGSYVTDSNPAIGAQKDNFGLYALKHDRSAATNKKGLLLHIPIKLPSKNKSGSSSNNNTLRKEINHEKFQSCEKNKRQPERGQSSSLDESVGSVNDCQELHFDIESENEVRQSKPAVPTRRRKISQPSVPDPVPKKHSAAPTKSLIIKKSVLEKKDINIRNIQATEPKSLASFVKQNRPDTIQTHPNVKENVKRGHNRNKSIDIFVKDENLFQEFDKMFDKNIKDAPKEPPLTIKLEMSSESKDYSSSSSSNPSSFEEEMAAMRANTERRFSSTIKVQNFNEQNIPRCKSILSPQHTGGSKRPSVAIESESSSNELKSPTMVTNTVKKIPQSILKQRIPSPNNDASKQPQKIISPVKQSNNNNKNTPNRKFFVYYNDEDELVFNQEYKNSQNQNEPPTNNNNNSKNVSTKNNVSAQPLSLYTGNPAEYHHKYNLSDFNHNDVIYRNYYNVDPNDSLRSMASSSDGIFI